MPNKVPQHVMKERKMEVLRLSEQMAFELRSQYLNRQLLVLTESRDEHNPLFITGHTANFLPVLIEDDSLESNQIVLVELIENTPKGLIGKIKKE